MWGTSPDHYRDIEDTPQVREYLRYSPHLHTTGEQPVAPPEWRPLTSELKKLPTDGT